LVIEFYLVLLFSLKIVLVRKGRVISALDVVEIFTIGGMNRNKVLFYKIETGRSSFQQNKDWVLLCSKLDIGFNSK